MENIIETIRAASSADASPEARAAAAQACRALLATLEPATITPIPSEVPATVTPNAPVPTSAPMSRADAVTLVQSIATVVRGMTPDQLFDLAIVKLRGALPPGTEVKPAKGVSFPIVPVAHLGGAS